MTKKRFRFLLAVIVLLLVSIICGLVGAAHKPHSSRSRASQTETTDPPMSYVETTLAQWQTWPLMLVNRTHAVPDDYVPPLFTLENGQQFDARM